MSVPYTFAGQAGPLPLQELDADFAFLANFGNIASGTFTITGVGFSGAAPTMLVTWHMIGPVVTLHFDSTGVNAPSNSTSFSFTGIPAALQPTFLTQEFRVGAIDASAEVNDASVQLGTTSPGSFNMLRDGLTAGWTATGNKGFGAATITYLLA
jgi:hypothetical protein